MARVDWIKASEGWGDGGCHCGCNLLKTDFETILGLIDFNIFHVFVSVLGLHGKEHSVFPLEIIQPTLYVRLLIGWCTACFSGVWG